MNYIMVLAMVTSFAIESFIGLPKMIVIEKKEIVVTEKKEVVRETRIDSIHRENEIIRRYS